MSDSELLEAATTYKNKGNESFKAKNLSEAERNYRGGLVYAETIKEESKENQDLKKILY